MNTSNSTSSIRSGLTVTSGLDQHELRERLAQSVKKPSKSAAGSGRRRRLGAMDVGTNSVRMLIISLNLDDFSFSVISDRRESVRLGQDEFANSRMTPAAMDRAATVIARFCDVARGFGVDDILTVATSAVREAENQQDFLQRVRRESSLELNVVSGLEEARLVYLGVSAGAPMDGRRVLFVDVGGGSTEMIVGDRRSHDLLESLKIGTIRLANMFLGDASAPVSDQTYAAMQDYIRGVAVHAVRNARDSRFDIAIGSSGSMVNLGEMAAAMRGEKPTSYNHYPVSLEDLRRVRETMCSLPIEERRKIPGIRPDRADITIAAAAIIETLMESLEIPHIYCSLYGLRQGLVVDHILRDAEGREVYMGFTPRHRSVRRLSRLCGCDRKHCEQVRRLGLQMFDQLKAMNLHTMTLEDRELLEHSAWLHDTGFFVSHADHHRHSYYIIRNGELLGFNDREKALMANMALYHRKSQPRRRHKNMRELDERDKTAVQKLSVLLRLAEGLDRSHLSLVQKLEFVEEGPQNGLSLLLSSRSDCQLEIWGVEPHLPLFKSAYGRRLQVKVRGKEQPGAAAEKPARAGAKRAARASLKSK